MKNVKQSRAIYYAYRKKDIEEKENKIKELGMWEDFKSFAKQKNYTHYRFALTNFLKVLGL